MSQIGPIKEYWMYTGLGSTMIDLLLFYSPGCVILAIFME